MKEATIVEPSDCLALDGGALLTKSNFRLLLPAIVGLLIAVAGNAADGPAAGGKPPTAGNYPVKPIRWVVPFAPGGGTDIIARPIALKLGDRLGQSILYDNRGGGGGVIAGDIVAKANPDGYTLLVEAVAVMTVNVSLMKMPLDQGQDFAPVTKFAKVPSILVVSDPFEVR